MMNSLLPPFLRQTWVVIGVLLNVLGQGMVLSYSNSLIPALQAPESTIKIDINTASWIVSSISVAGIGGYTVSSGLMDVIGRKKIYAIVQIPAIIGWLLIAFAPNVTAIIIGRLLGGFTGCATVCLGAVVIGEYTSPPNRGTFLNLKTTFVSLGNTLMHLLGHYYHWRTIALIGIIPVVLALANIITWPESPAWLASKGQFERSRIAFEWLRGTDDASRKEFEEMIRVQREKLATNPPKTSFITQMKEFFLKFKRRDFLLPTIIIFFGMLLLETCGRHVFPAYALQIVSEVTGNEGDSFYYTLGMDIIIILSTLLCSLLVRVLKRRTLLFFSGFIALMLLLTSCLYLFLLDRGLISSAYSWVPIILFLLYFIVVNLGCTPIPLSLLGEVFPLPHRGAGTLVSGFMISITLFFVLQVTPYLLLTVKVYGTFCLFGVLMGLSLSVLYFILPETKNRTLQQIEDHFNKKK